MYTKKDFTHLLGMEGFSDNLLQEHFKLYEGYVSNMNKLNDTLVAIEKNNGWNTPEFAELNRHLGWEFNGMRLHELYFGNMSKNPQKLSEDSSLYKKIVKEWDTFTMFEKDFISMGAMRGIGWVVLYYDKQENRLFNVWINEHDLGHFAGAIPLLVMDVFEHAYIRDYGLSRADYISTFVKSIDWEVVEKRLIE